MSMLLASRKYRRVHLKRRDKSSAMEPSIAWYTFPSISNFPTVSPLRSINALSCQQVAETMSNEQSSRSHRHLTLSVP